MSELGEVLDMAADMVISDLSLSSNRLLSPFMPPRAWPGDHQIKHINKKTHT